jgi:dihydrofolate synthase/folylpolyglutamate synthase
MARALTLGGYRTGLYTSPHISAFAERIQIDGIPIAPFVLRRYQEEVQTILTFHRIPATFFEWATLVAFLYFREQNVDIAIIETGLGGRFDATNIVQPEVSIITSIGFDHVEILGNTLEEIAREKGGIIKDRTPVVVGPDAPTDTLFEIAKNKRAPFYQNTIRHLDYDKENQDTAQAALRLLQGRFPLSDIEIEQGLQARPPCRFEPTLYRGKEVILDVAHNPHGIQRLIERLRDRYPNQPYHFITAFSASKDIAECAKLLEQAATRITLTKANHPRLANTDAIARFFSHGSHNITASVQEAIDGAIDYRDNAIIVITGSFFIMADAREALGITVPRDSHIWYNPFKPFIGAPSDLKCRASSSK